MNFVGTVAQAASDVAWMLIPVGVFLGAVFFAGYQYWGDGPVGVPYGYADGDGSNDASGNDVGSSSVEAEDERWFQQRDAAVIAPPPPPPPVREPEPEAYVPTDEELAMWARARRDAEEEEAATRGWTRSSTSWMHDE